MATVKGGTVYKQKLEQIRRSIKTARSVKVGFIEGATEADGASVPMVAAVNEFGVPARGQPPRPFFRRMIKAKRDEWGPALAGLMKANDYDGKLCLEQLGDGIEGQLRQSITDLVDPPLAPATVKRKGFDKPLIDTSTLINSVTHQVD